MVKQLAYIGAGVVILGLGYHIYNANLVRADLQKQYQTLSSDYQGLKKDNNTMQGDIQYFSDPHNLEKELRGENYRAPNEKVIIVAPPK